MKYNYKNTNQFFVNLKAVNDAAEKLTKEARMASAFYKLVELPEFSEGKFISDLYVSGGLELVSKYIKFVESGEYSNEVTCKFKDWYDNLTYDPADPNRLY